MSNKQVVIIRKEKYFVPEGLTIINHRIGGVEFYDETGKNCSLFYSGYTSDVNDNQPYIMTSYQKRIPLEKVL